MNKGIYLVIDPAMDEHVLLEKLDLILGERIIAIQLWDNFGDHQSVAKLVQQVCERCSPANIPVLINNRWEHLRNSPLSGVHFDKVPQGLEKIKATLGRPFIAGLTCNNDLSVVRWAADHQLDYISFCSMFPSSTANSCELVDFGTVREAHRIFHKPIFLAGGIRPGNLNKLDGLDYDGIAVVSGIMNAEDPRKSISEYYEQLLSRP